MTAKRFLNKGERRAVEEAVAAAEKTTAAEFVCAIATESGRYDRAESIIGLAVSLIAMTGVYTVMTWSPASSWGSVRPMLLGELAASAVGGFVLGSILASYWHTLRRLFVGRHEMDTEVERSASHVFAAARLTSTREHGGVLLYVSLFERRAVVLADTGAGRVLGREGIDALRDLAVARLREGRRLETFTDTVRAAAERLAPALPATATNPDELPNALLVFHPRP
jgi:putative membrane protein